MVLDVAPLLCPFTTTLDIFTLRKDTTKQHYNNIELNVPDNASLVVYQVALAKHWLVMGLKTENSPIDAHLSKMEATMENIASLVTVGNLVVNQLMEHEVAAAFTANAASTQEPKWTTVMANNMRQVVNQVVETLADVPKQEKPKLNMRLTRFEAKEGEVVKELV
jgi:hypothetical protein